MANSRIITARGAVNGVNTVFSAGEAAEPNSLRYILNGRIHGPGTGEDYLFTETDAALGQITVSVPPEDGDTVQLFYVDRSTPEGVALPKIQGVLRTTSARLTGTLKGTVTSSLTGRLS